MESSAAHGSGPSRPPPMHQYLKNGLLVSGVASAFAGSLLGMLTAMLVNVALIEVTISAIFAVYFAVVSFGSSLWIAMRVLAGRSPDPDENHQSQLLFFAGVVAVSGVLSILMWAGVFRHSAALLKTAVYGILGTSVAFALTFSVVDFVNVLWGLTQNSASKPLVQSLSQVRLVLFIAVIMGSIFGAAFGFLRVDEDILLHTQLALARENSYCLPLGALVGGLGGFGNEVLRLRTQQGAWSRIPPEFAADI